MESTRRWHLLVVCAAAFLAYINSIDCDFVYDDQAAIKVNADVHGNTTLATVFKNDFWGNPMDVEKSHKSYRPLTILSFRLTFAVARLLTGEGLQHRFFHVENLAYHVAVSLVFYMFCRHFISASASVYSAILFAVHPVHVEAVTGLVGRAELQSALFYQLLLVVYVRVTRGNRSAGGEAILLLLAMPLLGAAAMLCKETGVTALGVCIVYETVHSRLLPRITNRSSSRAAFVERKKRSFRSVTSSGFARPLVRFGVLLLSVIVVMLGRLYVMKGRMPYFTAFDNPASKEDSPARQLTYAYLLVPNAILLAFPFELLSDWSMGTIPVVQSVFDPRNLYTAVLFAGVLALVIAAWRQFFPVPSANQSGSRSTTTFHQQQFLIVAGSLIAIPFLPASNLLFPVGFVVAERVLYLPSIGWCMLVGKGVAVILHNKRTWDWRAIVPTSLSLAVGLKKRIMPSPGICRRLVILFLVLYSGALVARTLLRTEDWVTERRLFLSAVRSSGRVNAKCWNNIGHSYESNETTDSLLTAMSYFRMASRVQFNDIGAYQNVARMLTKLNRSDEAEAIYRRAIDMFPNAPAKGEKLRRVSERDLNIFLNLGSMKADNDSFDEAETLYRSVMHMRPGEDDHNQTPLGKSFYCHPLTDYIDTYFYLGDLLTRSQRFPEAITLYETAIGLAPRRHELYHNLAVVYMKRDQSAIALKYFNMALQLNGNHPESLGNSGVLLVNSKVPETMREGVGRLERAFRFQKLAQYAFNAGMGYFDLGETDNAILWLREAVALDGSYVKALFNLATLLRDKPDKKAESLELAQKVVALDEKHVNAWLLVGELQTRFMHDAEAAREAFSMAKQSNPEAIMAHHNYCATFNEESRYEKALECFEQVRKKLPETGLNQYRATLKKVMMDTRRKAVIAQEESL